MYSDYIYVIQTSVQVPHMFYSHVRTLNGFIEAIISFFVWLIEK